MNAEDHALIIHAIVDLRLRGPVLAVASDFTPDMVPQVSEEDAANFLAFLEANAAEVATWPEWKQKAFRLVKDGER